jgi:hypothetical protein
MPTLRERFGHFLLAPKIAQIERLTNDLIGIYASRPTPMSPESFVTKLGELDSEYIDFLLRQLKQGVSAEPNETARLQAVSESRSLYVWDVVTQSIIDLWTDYGFGVHVSITPRNDKAAEFFSEFWESEDNQAVLNERDLHVLSTDLLKDGEFFFAFFTARIDGTTIVRTVPTTEIKEVITDPEDSKVILYFKRESSDDKGMVTTQYYPDWRASKKQLAKAELPDDAITADKVKSDLNTGTDVVMMQVAHRKLNNRGWPLMTAGAVWSRAYKNFLQDRASVSRAVASYVDKLVVKGGSRGIDALKARLQSSLVSGVGMTDTNPPPTAGSTWIENEGVSRERMSLSTGAGDAAQDSAAILGQAALAGRIYPHYLGRGEAYRLATVTAMEGPVLRAFNRYQLFWSSVWEDVVKLVLIAGEEYGGKKFSDYTADINTDSILQMDFNNIAPATQQLISLMGQGLIADPVAADVAEKLITAALQTMGIKDASDVFIPEKGKDEEYIPPILKPKPEPTPQPSGDGIIPVPQTDKNAPAPGDQIVDKIADGMAKSGEVELPAEIKEFINGLLKGELNQAAQEGGEAKPFRKHPDGSIDFWDYALREEAQRSGLRILEEPDSL